MHIQTRIPAVILLFTILFIFTSCSITFDNEPADEQDLSSLVTFNRSVASFVSMLAPDSEVTGERASARTINIGLDTDSSVDMFSILDDGDNGSKSPLEIYNETLYRPSGSIARIPSASGDQLIENFYNDESLEAYFTLSPTESDDYLEVELYVYDRSSLYLDYEYENYLVQKDDTGWNYYRDTTGTVEGFIELSSHYYDGTVLQKDTDPAQIIFPDWSVFDNNVYDISFPEISQANLEDYTFDFLAKDPTFTDDSSVSYDEPARDQDSGDFYLRTLGTMEDNRISRTYEVLNYYAEYDSQDVRNGLSYIIKPLSFAVGNDRSSSSRADVGNSRDYIRTVVRSHALYDGNSLDTRSIRSLTEFNNSFESQEMTIEHDDDGLVVFSQENREYKDDDLNTVKVLGIYEMQESASSTAANKKYTGSYAETKNKKTTNYTVVYDDGELTLTRSKNSRGFIGQEFSVDLDDLQAGETFEVKLSGGGLFSGYLSSGAFIGSYTPLGGATQDIVVDSGMIILDGEIVEQ